MTTGPGLQTRYDLDAWARFLDADNDTDAATAIRRSIDAVDDLSTDLHRIALRFAGAPDNEISQRLSQAVDAVVVSAAPLLNLLHAYQRHERGK